jgi:hypothetical protein
LLAGRGVERHLTRPKGTTMTATQITHAFEIGCRYGCRAAGDSDIIYRYTVVDRTAKFITVVDDYGRRRRCGVKTHNGIEWAEPEGQYAWSPSIVANRPE